MNMGAAGMNTPINHKAHIVAELQDRLADAGDEDAELLAEQLSAQADDLERCIVHVLRGAREDEATDEALGAIISDMQERRRRIRERAEKRRAACAWAMGEAGIPKIAAPDMTVSWRIGKAPVSYSIEPRDAPPNFVRTKVEWRFDNDAVREALDKGDALDFATYGNPQPILTIRSK